MLKYGILGLSILGLAVGCKASERSSEPAGSATATEAELSSSGVVTSSPSTAPATLAMAPVKGAPSAYDCIITDHSLAMEGLDPLSLVPVVADKDLYVLAQDESGWFIHRMSGILGDGTCQITRNVEFGTEGRLRLEEAPLDFGVQGARILILGANPQVISTGGQKLYACESARGLTRLAAGPRMVGRKSSGELVAIHLGEEGCTTEPIWSNNQWKATNFITQNDEGVLGFIARREDGASALAIGVSESIRLWDSVPEESTLGFGRVTSIFATDDGFGLAESVQQRISWVSTEGHYQGAVSMRDPIGTATYFVPMRIVRAGEGTFVATGWVQPDEETRAPKLYAFSASNP